MVGTYNSRWMAGRVCQPMVDVAQSRTELGLGLGPLEVADLAGSLSQAGLFI